MTSADIRNVIATTLLAIVAITTYVAGLWTAWVYLFQKLPMPFGIIAISGCIISPIQLIIDLIKEKNTKRARDEASG